jgi:hypothetical protein
MASQLSKQSEKRILEALEKVSSLVATGEHPNDAIYKIASEQKLPAGHVRLMVNAVNTGRTNSHRATADDPLEKAAEFPLAEADTILSRLYPDNVKTAAAIFLEKVVDPQYNRSPSWLKDHKRTKTASAPISFKMTDKKPVVEHDPDRDVKRAMALVQRNGHTVDAARLRVERLRQQAVKTAEELRTYFKRPGHIPFAEVKENAVIMFGKTAATILNVVNPTKAQLAEKRSSFELNTAAAPFTTIKNAIALAVEFKQAQEAYVAAVKTANDDAHRVLSPFAPGPEAGRSVLGLQFSQTTEKTSNLGNLFSSALGMTALGDIAKDVGKKVPGMQPSSDLERKDMQSLMDPAHDMEIRNIQSEALLNDLIANDEVIRGHDPEDVIDAFNEVSQLAPYAVNKKAIMRDLMRKRLAGGGAALDQFTVSDALKSQQSLRDLNTVDPGALAAMSSVGVLPSAVQPTSRSVMASR